MIRKAFVPHATIIRYLRSLENSRFMATTDDIRHGCGFSAEVAACAIVDLVGMGALRTSHDHGWWELTEYGWENDWVKAMEE